MGWVLAILGLLADIHLLSATNAESTKSKSLKDAYTQPFLNLRAMVPGSFMVASCNRTRAVYAFSPNIKE